MGNIVLDFDDFSEENSKMELLFILRNTIPNFKVTLFTIPGKCSYRWLSHIVDMYHKWIELAVHGKNHTMCECTNWDEEFIINLLDYCSLSSSCNGRKIFQKIFKAPNWATTDVLYKVIKDKNWIIADHPKNKNNRPEGVKVYDMVKDVSVHGHIQNVCGNGLEEIFDYYSNLKGNFMFISEFMKGKN